MLISDFQQQVLQKLEEIVQEQREQTQMQRQILSILAPVHREEELFTKPLDSVEEFDNMCTKFREDTSFKKKHGIYFGLRLYQIFFIV